MLLSIVDVWHAVVLRGENVEPQCDESYADHQGNDGLVALFERQGHTEATEGNENNGYECQHLREAQCNVDRSALRDSLEDSPTKLAPSPRRIYIVRSH